MVPVYSEIIDFIAAGSTPNDVVSFRPSPAAQSRVNELMEKQKSDELTKAEKNELESFVTLEHIMRMAKAKARILLAK